MKENFKNPPRDCPLCPRLVAFRQENRAENPNWWNGPVPAFGSLDAKLLIVGLAPGLRGANATGRPFTGDYAGVILYGALKKAGLAKGEYDPVAFIEKFGSPLAGEQMKREALNRGGNKINSHKNANTPHPNPPPQGGREFGGDGFTLIHTRVTNAVRCVPPQNKPTPDEIRTCNQFLVREVAAMPNLRVILSLGSISHQAVLRALGKKLSSAKFGHGAEHTIIVTPHLVREGLAKTEADPGMRRGDTIVLLDSYHTSRYNMNTGALTEKMFEKVVARAKELIK